MWVEFSPSNYSLEFSNSRCHDNRETPRSLHSSPESSRDPLAFQLSPEPQPSMSFRRRRRSTPHDFRSQECSPSSNSPGKSLMTGSVPNCLRYSTEEVNSLIRSVDHLPGNLVPCPICNKIVKRERLRPHINECHLLDGKRIFCPLCCVAFKSKGSYRVHVWRHRRGTAGSATPYWVKNLHSIDKSISPLFCKHLHRISATTPSPAKLLIS